jgi:hypothetical protein
MKSIKQFRKIIAVLMVFILMGEFTGCYSTQNLTISDISSSDIYFVHAKSVTYPVDSVVISEGVLSGKLELTMNSKGNVNKSKENGPSDKSKPIKNHIYLSSGSGIEIENDNLSVPVQSITKIEQKIPDPGRTKALNTILIGCSILTIAGIILTVVIIKGSEEAYNTMTEMYLCGDAAP